VLHYDNHVSGTGVWHVQAQGWWLLREGCDGCSNHSKAQSGNEMDFHIEFPSKASHPQITSS
jgi:hypothetical protein